MTRVPINPELLEWARERSGKRRRTSRHGSGSYPNGRAARRSPPSNRWRRLWASGNGYQPAAVATFLQVADYWLVAHALAHHCAVVTHEVPADTIRRIKIPNACIGLGLHCLSPYEMLRRERARFVLGPSREVA